MIIKRYIIRTVLQSMLMVTLFLLALQFFILLVNELDDIGTGGYTVFDALQYVFLRVPFEVYNFSPIACLMGALVGLGLLSSNNELVVARMAGLSQTQIILTVLQLGFVVLLGLSVVGESWVPKLLAFAETQKVLLKSGGQAIKTQHGIWLKEKNNFIYIAKARGDHTLAGVIQYQFDGNGRIVLTRSIAQAHFVDNAWQLKRVTTSTVTDKGTEVSKAKNMIWGLALSPQRISVSERSMDEMSLRQLWYYIDLQKRQQVPVKAYEMNFWHRLFQPLSAMVMMLLALPFIFGSLRDKTMGYRVMMGTLAGFFFYILNRVVMSVGLIYRLEPLWITLAPTLFFFVLTTGLMLRQQLRRG